MKKFSVLLYLTEVYESIRNKIDHLCYRIFLRNDRWSEIILATAKNKFRIICIEVTICPVCCWCIFRLSLSFTDFISSVSEWLTAVLKFLKCFLLSRFHSFWMNFASIWEFASISYHLIIALKNMFVSTIKEVIKKIFLRRRSPMSYCETKNIARVFVFAKGIHTRCWLETKLKCYLRKSTAACDTHVLV